MSPLLIDSEDLDLYANGVLRGIPSDPTIGFIKQEAEKIQGEWNGEDPGKLEDRANLAEGLIELLNTAEEWAKELGIIEE